MATTVDSWRRTRGLAGWTLEPRRSIGQLDILTGGLTLGFLGLFTLLFADRDPGADRLHDVVVGLVGMRIQSGPAVLLYQLKDLAYSQFSNYDLSVLPMFILMGGLASRCGLSQNLFRGANALIGRFRGGVAMAAIAACGGFGAVCGSSTATASTMGQVALPELRRYRYCRRSPPGRLPPEARSAS